ncbi:LysR family glycine cleavage system transcriptional activator [Azospirillum brasilense]|uniref:LysR family glycine cleavage system transcriptional activator n=1 Tax=Azospirillum brasilense TaxID=192 RepID=A0A560CSQ9_AZOBR|nr:LysR substrate-binding domain-containing protein [Azospirillum brasilense]TWA87898.1 LysR family glycine cleavage system transcriptional activator [Azospirillum brasilense]
MSLDHPTPGHPSLLAVRAFEAAARLGSFTRAAEELCLTQSAVSRHVRALEQCFAVDLFARRGRHIALTEEGRDYFGAVADGLERIRRANDALLRRGRRDERVTLSLLPSVAALWLAPRLPDFTGRFPDVDLRIQASMALADLRRDGIDLALRYGLGTWAGLRAELLAEERLIPVCAPAYARSLELGGDPACLRPALLLTDNIPGGWANWLRAAGLEPAGMRFGPRFDEGTSLYRAAAAGAGVALGRSLLVARDIAEGRLAVATPFSIPATYSYWLVQPEEQKPGRATGLLADWLREQAAGPAAAVSRPADSRSA